MSKIAKIWDLPTRLFHWLLVLCIIGLFITGKASPLMAWHFRLGYFLVALLLFRLLWGLVGGCWSRFRSFIYTPSQTLAWLRGQGTPAMHAGHSPTGALSVFAMLLLIGLQVLAGLSGDDDIFYAGPLAAVMPDWVTDHALTWHRTWGHYLLLGMIALHIAAIIFYWLVQRNNLVKTMITGDKVMEDDVPSASDTWRTRLLAAIVFALCAAVAWWLSTM